MPTSRRFPALASALALAVLALAAPALAAPALAEPEKKGDPGGAVVVLLGLLVLTPSFHLLAAVLFPGYVKRCRRAFAESIWPCLGWGILTLILVAIVAGVLGKGGGPGQTLSALVLAATAAVALAAVASYALRMGDAVLAQWGVGPLGPLSVFIGSVLWSWGSALPVVGWAIGGTLLIAALGAGVRVMLNPAAFDDPPAPPPSLSDPDPSSEAAEPLP